MRRYTIVMLLSAFLLGPVLMGCEHTTETKRNPITGSETKTDKVSGD